jgi:hypothetical protein
MSSKQRNDVWRPFWSNAEGRRQRSREWRFLRSIRRLASGFLNWDRVQETSCGRQGSPTEPAWLTVPGVIGCPICGALYMAEANASGDAEELEDQELEAIDYLAEECPDHPHYFLVGV